MGLKVAFFVWTNPRLNIYELATITKTTWDLDGATQRHCAWAVYNLATNFFGNHNVFFFIARSMQNPKHHFFRFQLCADPTLRNLGNLQIVHILVHVCGVVKQNGYVLKYL